MHKACFYNSLRPHQKSIFFLSCFMALVIKWTFIFLGYPDLQRSVINLRIFVWKPPPT